MAWILAALCAASAGYQLTALLAVLRQLWRRDPTLGRYTPAVSILKPVHGRDRFFDGAIQSHASIDYPRYEIRFALGSPEDPAHEVVRRVAGAHLHYRVEQTPNPKAGSLMELERHATGEVWVINDGDIRVTPSYLNRVVAPLADSGIALVTCLYRPIAHGLPAMWEALGIATDFAPSTLVAPLVGIGEFGLGSTLCFRAAEWKRLGGFESIASYLADDYQLASRLTRGQGKRAWMSRYVVDTGLEYGSWRAMWKHQVRWARTIRHNRAEYAGLPVTHAGLWAALALALGHADWALGLAALRMSTGFLAGAVLLRSGTGWALPLMPVWDLFAFAVWISGYTGRTIEWRGQRMRIGAGGRLADS